MICPCCDKEVLLSDAEPMCARPDAWLEISRADRARSKATDDGCVISLSMGDLYFVRGVAPFAVDGRSRPLHWGLWVQVKPQAFERIVELWQSLAQNREPPIQGQLANRLPLYPDTRGLPCLLQLRSPKQRPSITLLGDHLLATEQRSGVMPHRASDWLRAMLD